ncbi:MAG: lycopene cyclase domain-containing protein [Candidatus Kapabacteria bacterium]|nr:lycopene cyclase domain-containing protein [Candidatus Kapabacteria bacterium]
MLMTYLGFHLRMTLPLLGLCMLCWLLAGPSAEALTAIAVLCAVVVVFTFPWDSWAVRRGVWDFPDDRLLGRIGVLPYEEVAFFVIQTLQVSFLTLALVRWFPTDATRVLEVSIPGLTVSGVILALTVVIGILTRGVRSRRRDITYAWHLGIWFLPLISAQWGFGWSILSPRLPVIAASTLAIGTILTLADVWAVRRGIWFFDDKQITGIMLGKILPWEEAAFFCVTSLLVAQSILLFIPESLR